MLRDAASPIVVKRHVRRVVVVFVHSFELAVLQLRDFLGVSARVVGVRSSFEQVLVDCQDELAVGVLVRPLHLVENYALELLLPLFVDFESPPLLEEVKLVE